MKLFGFLKRFPFTGASSKKPFVFVAVGDSAVEGWGASNPDKGFASLVFSAIKRHAKNPRFYNLGKGGAKVGDVLKHQLDEAINLQPDLVLVSVGANDIMRATRGSSFDKEFKLLLKRLHEETGAKIVVNNIPDITLAPSVPRLFVPFCKIWAKRFNEIIKKYAEEFNAILVDLYSQSLNFKGYKEFISSDGLHPSDAGYALWANAVITKIYPLIAN